MTDTHPAPQLALIALSEAAVQGEWTIGKIDHDGARIDCGDWEQVAYVWQTTRRYVPGDSLDATGPEFGVDNPQANAEFIAALVNWFRANYSTQSLPEAELPDLPESYGTHCVWDSVRMMKEPGYTADQMRAYGQQCAATRQPIASDDDMLPDALVPHSKEWYRLCERRFSVDRMTISGPLAEAIVEAVSARATRPAEVGGDGVDMDSDERVAVDFYTSNPSAALFDMRRRISDKTVTPGLQAAVSRLLASLKVETFVKPSTKNANAGFVDMRDWYALQGEVMAVESALTPPAPGSEAKS